jgi:hypothetical protein
VALVSQQSGQRLEAPSAMATAVNQNEVRHRGSTIITVPMACGRNHVCG